MDRATSSKKTSSRRHFDRWAGRYEQDPISRWLAGRQEDALEALDLHDDDRVLDVGCGTGAAVRHAAPFSAQPPSTTIPTRIRRPARWHACWHREVGP
jgi:ubiquinone/menaquinone biosynthesis C-methylase UbiE